MVDAEGAQILIEVAEPGRPRDRFDTGGVGTPRQSGQRRVAGRIGIARDIETA